MRSSSWNYKRTHDGIRITEYIPDGDGEYASVPSCIDGFPVTEIGKDTFYLTPVTEVSLPDSLKRIEDPWELGGMRFHTSGNNPCFFTDGFALYERHESEQVLLVSYSGDERESYEVLPGTTVIGENALSGNNFLKKAVLPDTVHSIEAAAFEACEQLCIVALGEGLKEIGTDAFSHCIRLEEIYLPASLEAVGERALSDTFGWSDSFPGIRHISVDPANRRFASDESGFFELDDRGQRRLIKYLGRGEEYHVPADVSSILTVAFRRADVRRVIIPDSVMSIGRDAFKECRYLEEIRLGEDGFSVYIPGQPRYRKDEVTALFCRKRDEAGELFDREGYDRIFPSWINVTDKCGIACTRLSDPVTPDKDTAQTYRDYIEGHFAEILEDIAKNQDLGLLRRLSDLGFLVGERCEQALDACAGRGSLMGYLLSRGINRDDFDYLL